MDINRTLISGKVAYRDPLRFWLEPDTGRDVPLVSLLLNHERVTGRGRMVTDQFRVTIWDISDAQDACLNVGTSIVLDARIKSRRIGRGTGVLTAELTVKANEAGSIYFGPKAYTDTLPVANLPDLLRQLGWDLPPGADQQLVAQAQAAIANPAPPFTGPTPEMQYQ